MPKDLDLPKGRGTSTQQQLAWIEELEIALDSVSPAHRELMVRAINGILQTAPYISRESLTYAAAAKTDLAALVRILSGDRLFVALAQSERHQPQLPQPKTEQKE
jgi:hypothetical protein